MLPLTHVHVLTFNSGPSVLTALRSVLDQEGFEIQKNLHLELTDNASFNDTATRVEVALPGKLSVFRNRQNLGFCAGHNQAVMRFLASEAQYLLILNPDAALHRLSLSRMVEALERTPAAGLATTLLVRGDSNLSEISPSVVDAAGMHMTKELRHLDRGSGQPLTKTYLEGGVVFGGTGACLLLKRACVQELLLDGGQKEGLIDRIYPQLREGRSDRAMLFDEGFFAYREDADLAWRANLLGWGTLFVPEARVVHERRVTPERRAVLSPELNRLSVRNRFLLQINNLTGEVLGATFLRGFLLRNLLVVAAVLLREQSSLGAFRDLRVLFGRACARRRALMERRRSIEPGRLQRLAPWFRGREIITGGDL